MTLILEPHEKEGKEEREREREREAGDWTVGLSRRNGGTNHNNHVRKESTMKIFDWPTLIYGVLMSFSGSRRPASFSSSPSSSSSSPPPPSSSSSFCCCFFFFFFLLFRCGRRFLLRRSRLRHQREMQKKTTTTNRQRWNWCRILNFALRFGCNRMRSAHRYAWYSRVLFFSVCVCVRVCEETERPRQKKKLWKCYAPKKR